MCGDLGLPVQNPLLVVRVGMFAELVLDMVAIYEGMVGRGTVGLTSSGHGSGLRKFGRPL